MSREQLTAALPEDYALNRLKDRLEELNQLVPRGSSVLYVDYPFYPNVGDLLINQGTELFFRKSGFQVRCRVSMQDFSVALPQPRPGDVFVFQGGGNIGDLYPEHAALLIQILDRFPDNRVVVMPQTVHFESEREQDRIVGRFSRSPQLSFVARDSVSRDTLNRYGLPDVRMLPDMAHLLHGVIEPLGRCVREDLYLIRRDEELAGLPSYLANNSRRFRDWKDALTFPQRLSFAVMKRRLARSVAKNRPWNVQPDWYRLHGSMVDSGNRMISAARHVHSNRLHAMILATLLGRRVSAFDNTYGKLGNYRATWLTDMASVSFDASTGNPRASMRTGKGAQGFIMLTGSDVSQ